MRTLSQIVIAAIALIVGLFLSAVLNSLLAGTLIAMCLAAAASQVLA